MPVGEDSKWQQSHFIEADTIRDNIGRLGELVPYRKNKVDGPAQLYDLTTKDGRRGVVGFISPISHHFCNECNRLRLTSEGKLRSCLLTDNETDLKHLVRNDGTDEEIMEQIRFNIQNKPKGHNLELGKGDTSSNPCQGKMSRIGG